MKSIIIISILRDLVPPSPTPGTSCLCSKLIKQISEQLAVKYRLGSHAAELVYFPSLSKWLLMVGVSAETYEVIQSTVRSLEELKEKTECELKSILLTSGRVSSKQIPEDLRRLCRS